MTTFKKGNKLGKGTQRQFRRDITLELVSQLNEFAKDENGVSRSKLHLVVRNLVDRAVEHVPVFDKDGHEIGVEKGDMQAIIHIFDRLEGKPRQTLEAKTETTIREYRSLEDVMSELIERGLDVTRLPPPMRIIEYKKKH